MDVNVIADPEENFGPTAIRHPFERGTDGPRLILVGVDGSPTSVHAAAYACGLARRQGCRLVVVYVCPLSSLAAMFSLTAAEAVRTFQEVAAGLRNDIRHAAEEQRIPITFITRRGDPFVELRDTATMLKADLVVVGLSAHHFFRSIASRLVRLGRWPVVVVP